MQFTIARHGRSVALVAVIASSLTLLGAIGAFGTLARFGDAAMESYDRFISDWARDNVERLNPTYPRCFLNFP
jgi:hypothetical protein